VYPYYLPQEKQGKPEYTEKMWKNFITESINNEYILLYPRIFKLFKSKEWFQKLNAFPIFLLLGDIMPHEKIGKETARAFLKLPHPTQEDLKKPENSKSLFSSFKSEDQMKFDHDKKLKLIEYVYLFAKKHNLKQIGKTVYDYMETLKMLPTDTGGRMLSFLEPEHTLASIKRKTDESSNPPAKKKK
jgi:hypothetical protein